MNPALHAEIVATAESRWQPYSEDSRGIKEGAEVDYVPAESAGPRYREPLRYVAIRIHKKQQALFADGSAVKYFAVVSNLWEWTPKRLLEWHREKAGSIEAVHDGIKNELAGGVMPCGRFGANAAWLRLAVLTYHVLTALKRLALPPELLTARPKRLRFLIFHTPGKLVHHARRTLLRLRWSWQRFSNWQYALRLLPLPAPGGNRTSQKNLPPISPHAESLAPHRSCERLFSGAASVQRLCPTLNSFPPPYPYPTNPANVLSKLLRTDYGLTADN
jgi:hypothetical protein